ncbi:hypothetical protein WN51_10053 [Melipona quadrifasciata]|uniref:Uncharacterized protein n=1 Tax=Melipona quadrifasciata TaxID=166423 RepID=A0A0N1IU59_9HYME|nr:hypothetical protein WN51_10053 [Melipona quadrifasciata]
MLGTIVSETAMLICVNILKLPSIPPMGKNRAKREKNSKGFENQWTKGLLVPTKGERDILGRSHHCIVVNILGLINLTDDEVLVFVFNFWSLKI